MKLPGARYFTVCSLLVVLLLGTGTGNSVWCLGLADHRHPGSIDHGSCRQPNLRPGATPALAGTAVEPCRNHCGPCRDLRFPQDLQRQRPLPGPTLAATALTADRRFLPPLLLNTKLLAAPSCHTTATQRALRCTVLRC